MLRAWVFPFPSVCIYSVINPAPSRPLTSDHSAGGANGHEADKGKGGGNSGGNSGGAGKRVPLQEAQRRLRALGQPVTCVCFFGCAGGCMVL